MSMFGLDSRCSCKEYFRQYNIMTVYDLYIYELLEYIHANKSKFSIGSDFHIYNTRYKSNFVVPLHQLSTYNRTLMVQGIKLYNRLTDNMKQMTEMNNFKNCVKKIILGVCPYSFNEFVQTL
ncbi:hypothetical protein C0J52_20381 [Blattella germanica]|nr:hypothetical protein C0J52_20381 [Blattella germanica]